MKIVYTKHALKKFSDFKKLKIIITKKQIASVINNPIHLDTETDPSKIIASGTLSEALILRVVFRREDDIITVITFYPAKRGRYFV